MPEFSNEFWVGTALAILAFLLGIAVALGMDSKTKGEFRFVVSCFVISASIVCYGIVELDMTMKWTSFPRVLTIYALLSLAVLLTGEAIRWASGRHTRAYVGEEINPEKTIEKPPNPAPAKPEPVPHSSSVPPPRKSRTQEQLKALLEQPVPATPTFDNDTPSQLSERARYSANLLSEVASNWEAEDHNEYMRMTDYIYAHGTNEQQTKVTKDWEIRKEEIATEWLKRAHDQIQIADLCRKAIEKRSAPLNPDESDPRIKKQHEVFERLLDGKAAFGDLEDAAQYLRKIAREMMARTQS